MASTELAPFGVWGGGRGGGKEGEEKELGSLPSQRDVSNLREETAAEPESREPVTAAAPTPRTLTVAWGRAGSRRTRPHTFLMGPNTAAAVSRNSV